MFLCFVVGLIGPMVQKLVGLMCKRAYGGSALKGVWPSEHTLMHLLVVAVVALDREFDVFSE